LRLINSLTYLLTYLLTRENLLAVIIMQVVINDR